MCAVKVGWYLIYTRPRHEKKVAEYLKILNLEYFLPTVRTLKVWASKKKYVNLPLFPSYIFIKLQGVEDYIETTHLPGVLYYIRTDNQIAEISESIVSKLKALSSKKLNEDFEVSSENFDQGMIADIDSGPLKGFPCEVIQYKGKYQMLVRVELLQRNIIVDLPSYCLTPVKASRLVANY
ncbi:transcription termination/antitermination protein NusG [Mucilaginibacter agri]|uniref:UpxY family transcription antiterminator n=1 Tax=Mucilaginibacter agri TaxID=2695265 RepID=A0A966DTV2_9SPHI|nr:UpxY family transcription antiterminator [Mucilaginibacter agri]NCD71678.1 UpxY family transcription antiterminator [Mucilaginibacter agri]